MTTYRARAPDGQAMKISEVTLYRVRLPLITPYRLSYHTFETFEPMLVRLRDADGRIGWGEQHISPGSAEETPNGGWAFLQELCAQVVGLAPENAGILVAAAAPQSPVAATALNTAIEMLTGADLLSTDDGFSWPLLTAFNATTAEDIRAEVETRLEEGYRTFKIKVGKDVTADLQRLANIQDAVAGRATLRIDANRAFSEVDAITFAQSLSPDGIELFEQPCDAADWGANAAVASTSPVPLMLDEPICDEADIDRAAEIAGVGLCKLKLKRFGSLERLRAALDRVRGHGMQAVLGDGLGAEINCWMEACVACHSIDTTGEFNGYLKLPAEARLLQTPLPFEKGKIIVPAGYWPEVDEERLAAHCLQSIRCAPTAVTIGGTVDVAD